MSPVLPALVRSPRRDEASRSLVAELGRSVRPVVLAGERLLAVDGSLGGPLPALQRGTVVAVDGTLGSGLTSITCALAAAATRVGEWAAVLDAEGTLGGLAAAEAGVDLDRFAVVRSVPPSRWVTVVAALLDGLSLVIAPVPRHVRVGEARRLVARARERRAVLVTTGAWPAEAALRLRLDGTCWTVDHEAPALFGGRQWHVAVERRGVASRGRSRAG